MGGVRNLELLETSDLRSPKISPTRIPELELLMENLETLDLTNLE